MTTVSAPARDSASQPRVDGFPVGYYDLHPDVSLNYQMNRFSTGEADMIAEMRAIAPRIRDYTDYTREFLALGQEALGRGKTLNGAYYLRSAEFYLFGDDPRKQPTRRTYAQLMREYYGIEDKDHVMVPYEASALPVFRLAPPAQARGTIVLFGGFDGYAEDHFPIQLYFHQAGYDVVSFEGPGQGMALEEGHTALTPDWHKPVAAILDYFDLDNVTLMGVSLGGCLALRAAAFEPRVQRVVANDILTDFFDVSTAQLKPSAREELALLLKMGADRIVNTVVVRAMKESLVMDWGIKQGMRVTGATTPSALFTQVRQYRTDDVSPLVEQDVLLLAGAEDHYVPLHQFYDQIRSLTHARSVTASLFTRQEQAHEHIQVGNHGLQFRIIREWLEVMEERGEGGTGDDERATHSPAAGESASQSAGAPL